MADYAFGYALISEQCSLEELGKLEVANATLLF
jgi:hypothetical protein